MHINRKPGEQIEVDWAGNPAQITDPNTCEIIPAFLFVGVMTYSQYPYVEAFINEKQQAWIAAHVHMYECFSGVTRILVPDNTKTAVIHNNDWYNQELNTIYHEMAEHYSFMVAPLLRSLLHCQMDGDGETGQARMEWAQLVTASLTRDGGTVQR